MPSTEVTVTYLNIILYAVSYQLQRPVEPFLVRSLIHNSNSSSTHKSSDSDNPSINVYVNGSTEESAANQTYGRLTSFFSLLQTIGSPLVGTLLDRIGPRRTSILVYGGSALSYYILAHATTPTILYASKIPTLLQHAFLVGQATVAVSSLDDDDDDGNETNGNGEYGGHRQRAAALGRMTTAYTLGATIGPALGGYLADSNNDLYAGARLAVWGSLISVLLSIVYLKDHSSSSSSSTRRTAKVTKEQDKDKDHATTKTTNNKQSKAKQQTTPSFIQSIKKTLLFLRHPTIGPLLFIKLLNGISSSAFSTILPLILANKLHFTTTQLGYFMSASSISVAAFAAVGISITMGWVGNRPDRLASVGIGCRVLSIVCFGMIVSWVLSTTSSLADDASSNGNGGDDHGIALSTRGHVVATTLASVAISLSSHMHATSLTTLTTGTVSSEERGAILGLEHGLFSMARVVGPPLATTLLSNGSVVGRSFFADIGADGLWRVISFCVVMDCILMMLLRVWSTRQHEMSKKLGDDSKPLMDDHDHSD